MSRRRHEQSDEGSDSFLDVLANLVGILVVLVVMTALQAAVVPPRPVEPLADAPALIEPVADVAAAAIVAPPTPPEPEPEPVVKVARAPLMAPKPNVVYLPTPPPAIPYSLERDVAAAEANAAALRRRWAQETDAASTARGAAEAARSRAAAAVAEFRRSRSALSEAEAAGEDADRTADAARLDRDLWAAKAAAVGDKPPERLEHSALPVGRRVSGDELHFRLVGDPNDPKGGVVRTAPIDALTARLERDVQRNRQRVIDRGGYEGVVGPAAGYLMRYRIQQEGADVVNRIRTSAPNVVRFRLVGWTLEDAGEDPSVPVAAALAEGSDFRFALATAGPGATATFWVAPEAFGGFRTLREAVRQAGLSIAARPLPADVPITGSPNGSQSFAQ